MLITESLFVLLTNDQGKENPWGSQRSIGLAGTLVADLIAAGRIALSDDKDARVHVIDPSPTGNPVLDHGLDLLSRNKNKKLSSLVAKSAMNPEQQVTSNLAKAGIIDVEPKRLLGLVPAKYPTVNPGPEQSLRHRIGTALQTGSAETDIAVILSVLNGLDVAHKVLKEEAGGMSKGDLKRRISELTVDAGPEGVAVKKATEAIQVAAATAVVVAAAAAASS